MSPQVKGDSVLLGHSGTDMAVRGLHAKAVRDASPARVTAAQAAEQVHDFPFGSHGYPAPVAISLSDLRLVGRAGRGAWAIPASPLLPLQLREGWV